MPAIRNTSCTGLEMNAVILASDLTTCNRVVSSGLLANLSVASLTSSRSKETFVGSGEKGTVIFDALNRKLMATLEDYVHLYTFR
jgi:hypothetical protein